MSNQEFATEEALLAGLRRGEEAALASLYVRYWPLIARFVQVNNGQQEDARDLFQEGILAFYEKVRQSDFVLTCQIKTYFYSVCRYKWMSQLRSRQNLVDLEDYLENWSEEGEEPAELPDEERIREAVEQLGQPCRSILVGYYYQRLSLEDLARQMNYASANVVKQQKFRCVERLKKRFLY